jgi:hypothetical protein
MRGSSARLAGLLIRASDASSAATRYAGHSRSGVTASSGRSAAAWTTFVMINVRRRSSRSTMLPPSGPSSTAHASSTTKSAAVAEPEPLSVKT